MNDPHRLVGTYLLGLEPMLVSVEAGEIRLRLTGVPEDLAARVEGSGNSYVVRGSQFEGVTVDFTDGDPAPGGRLGKVIDFVRSDGEDENLTGRGLRLEEVVWEPGEEQAYRDLTDNVLERRDGSSIQWGLPWPKWRFVEWLSSEGDFIFHGSPLSDLDTFAPRRSSVEIMDQGGTGNRAAVYGTPYGLWAMWFAVIDRAKLKGSIRNGVMLWHDRSGHPVNLYRFTVHHDYVGGDIWRTGTLYLLPRDAFEPIPFYPGGPPSNEWASTSEVRPLASLTIDPGDFPFVDRVGGHDDGELIAAEVLGDVVRSKVRGVRAVPGGLAVSLTWDEAVAAIWDEYLRTINRFTPDVERTLTQDSPDEATMIVRGPAGFLQAYASSLAESGIHIDP